VVETSWPTNSKECSKEDKEEKDKEEEETMMICPEMTREFVSQKSIAITMMLVILFGNSSLVF